MNLASVKLNCEFPCFTFWQHFLTISRSTENEGLKKELEKENERYGPIFKQYLNVQCSLKSSESYKKLHDDYTSIRSKLADAEGQSESLDRQLADAKAECEFHLRL